ncbi:MAG: TolC family protein [Polyangiaceae bacterium]|nr:TolC family protein [Polyangiaceae bacterium]
MSSRRPLRWLVVSSLFVATPALAQTGSIGEQRAIEMAMTDNPSLRAALIDVRQADQQVLSAEGTFVPTLALDFGYTHTESPRASSTGEITKSQSDNWGAGAELRHTFPWGTQLTLRMEGNRTTSRVPVTSVAAQTATLGPTYGLTGRVSVVHPLLRGSGTTIGEAAIRQARLSRSVSERSRDQAASQLMRDVLVAYWELWYSDRATDIEKQARKLAAQQRDDTERRIKSGDLAPVDLLTFETRLSQLDESVAVAESSRRQKAVELSRLLGKDDPAGAISTSADAPPADLAAPVSLGAAQQAAMAQSPDIKQAEAQVTQARDKVKTAGENERARLDLEGYVQGDSLAYREVAPVASRFATEPAVSAHVGLIFELPLSGQTRTADRRAAELAVDSAQARLDSTRQSVRAQVTKAMVDVDTAKRRVELAEKTVKVAEQQVKAQEQRYASGEGIPLEVQQAEDSLRQARLSAERARVDRAQAVLTLEHLTGRLLSRYANTLSLPEGPRRDSAYLALRRPGPF